MASSSTHTKWVKREQVHAQSCSLPSGCLATHHTHVAFHFVNRGYVSACMCMFDTCLYLPTPSNRVARSLHLAGYTRRHRTYIGLTILTLSWSSYFLLMRRSLVFLIPTNAWTSFWGQASETPYNTVKEFISQHGWLHSRRIEANGGVD
jgi:hypothetical protein